LIIPDDREAVVGSQVADKLPLGHGEAYAFERPLEVCDVQLPRMGRIKGQAPLSKGVQSKALLPQVAREVPL
jgi:hypothetical protein